MERFDRLVAEQISGTDNSEQSATPNRIIVQKEIIGSKEDVDHMAKYFAAKGIAETIRSRADVYQDLRSDVRQS